MKKATASTATKEFTYREIVDVHNIIGTLSNTKNFPVDSMMKLLDLKKEVRELAEKYQTIFTEIMTQYKVSQIPQENSSQQVYSWAEHKDVEEISKKVFDLASSKVPLNNVNFLTPENFFQITEGFSLNHLEFLQKFLKV